MPRPGDRQLIREWNEGLVLDLIRRQGPIPRTEIADRTGLGRSTVTVITGRLLRQGLILESGSVASGDAGRRPMLLTLQSRSRAVVGLKLGPDSITAAALDLHAEIVIAEQRKLEDPSDPESVVGALAESARHVLERAGADLGPAIGAGLVMPGVIDAATGQSINPYYPSWARMEFRRRLEDMIEIPVLTDNDANAMALAEARYGAGGGVGTLLCLTVGVGIGAGLILEGRVHRGNRSGAGEIGHTVVAPGGPLCRCGRRGCLEAVASDGALETATGLSREELVRRAQRGDRHATRVLAEAGATIGVALANAVNLVGPERVIIGGEALFQAGELLLGPIREAVRQNAFPVLADLDVVAASLGGDAWVRGAAALVLEQAFRVPLESNGSDPITVTGDRGEEGVRWSARAAAGKR